MSDYQQYNTAKSNTFIFTITNRRDLTMKIQNSSVGSVNLGAAPFPMPMIDALVPGNKLDYGPMNLRFLVSENLTEWFEIYRWMIDITRANDAHLSQVETAELTVLNSENREIMRFIYTGVFPLTLGELTYSIVDDEQSLVADLTVQFDKFDVVNLITGESLIYE